jgi:hypothetical protein
MKDHARHLLVAAGLLLIAGVAVAQVDNDINVIAQGTGTDIDIVVTMRTGDDLPAEWVGWVIDRSTIGVCGPEVEIVSVQPFPGAEQTMTFSDASAQDSRTYEYQVFAVDAAGDRHYLGSPPAWPPAYYHFDYASANNDAPVAEGTLTDLYWTAGIELCEGHCWEWISFVSGLPAELEPYIDSGVVVRLHGEIDAEFEGPYISTVTGYTIVGDCSPVGNEARSWSALKSLFR